MLKKIGHIAIPRGFATYLRKELRPQLIRDRSIVQGRIDFKDEVVKKFHEEIVVRLNSALGTDVPLQAPESDYIRFRKVERHSDEWLAQMKEGKRWVPIAFLHVCVAGSCIVKTAATTLHVQRGDVFVLNPNVKHEVPSSTECITFCGITSRPWAKATPELKQAA